MSERLQNLKYRKDIVQLVASLFCAWVFTDYMNFSTTAVVVFPIAVGFYSLQKYTSSNGKEVLQRKNLYLLFSASISLMLVLCQHIHIDFGVYPGDITVDYIVNFSLYDIVAFVVLIYVFVFISYGLIKIFYKQKIIDFIKNGRNDSSIRKTGVANQRKVWMVAFILFICWLPYLILYYPGFIFGDSTSSISQALGQSYYNSHHPIFYTFFVKLCLYLGAFTGENTLGCAIYSIAQMIFMAWIFAYSVCWLKNKNVSKIVCMIVLLFFAMPRFWAQHAISMWKDPIFSALIYFYSLKLFDMIWSKGKILRERNYLLQCMFCTVGICFSRNNGIYVMIFSLIILVFWNCIELLEWRKSKNFLISTFICILFVWIIQGPGYKILGITGDPVESYGIPLQQVVRTVVYGGDMTEDEKEFLNQIMPLDKYKDNYSPVLVDRFKWSEEFNTEFFNTHQKEFIKVWISLFIKNPKLYIEAWELNTCGFWGMSFWQLNNDKDNISMGVPRGKEIKEVFEIEVGSLLKEGSTLDVLLKEYFSILTPMPSVALCLWIALFMIFFAAIKRKIKYILIFVPCIGNMITLFIASPISYWPRYGLSFICLLPICLVFPYLLIEEKEKIR